MSTKNPKHEHVTVYLSEEYGYREWVWHTGMTAEQLEVFWSQIDDAWHYCMDVTRFPGELIPFRSEDLPEDFNATEHWGAGIHMNDDSVLVAPGRRFIYHRGYTGRAR